MYWSTLKTYTQITFQTEQVIFRNIYVYTYAYIHVTMISEKRDYKFEREQEELDGKVWKEEWEGKMINYNIM